MIGLISTSLSDISFVGKLSNHFYKNDIPFKLLLTGQHTYDLKLSKRASSILNINRKYIFRYSKKNNNLNNIYLDTFSSTNDSLKFVEENKIKNILISGDRYEMLIAAIPLSQIGCNLIHYGAGQISKGSKDNLYRKCISILCNYHFVSTAKSKENLIKQEIFNANNISLTGSIGLDRVYEFLEKNNVGIREGKVLIALHPEVKDNKAIVNLVFDALEYAEKTFRQKLHIVLSLPNNDYQSEKSLKSIKEFLKLKEYSFEILSATSDEYFLHSLLSSHLIIGNSSSFVIEAPSLKKISIIIGSRQEDRESAKSVFHTFYDKKKLFESIDFAIKENHPNNYEKDDNLFANPYWQGGSCNNIISSLKKWNLLTK